LFCDITVMSEQARIGDTHVSRVGLVAGDGGAAIWPLLVGISRAKEFLMRGTLLSGTDAAEIGLVNHVVPGLDVLSMAREIALELAHGPVWATRWTKLSVNQLLKERINAVFTWRTTKRRHAPSPRSASPSSTAAEPPSAGHPDTPPTSSTRPRELTTTLQLSNSLLRGLQ
jgi:enoyl-CoA hydratase/carnithine racemase